jgi:hypothetical protein
MTSYEFCWTVLLDRKREWAQKFTVDGFDVQVSGDLILVRAGSLGISENELKARAEGIVAHLVRAMEYRERQRFTAELKHIRRLPDAGPEEIGLAFGDKIEMRDEARTTMFSYIGCGAVLVENPAKVKLREILQDFARLQRSRSLGRMFDLITEFRSDPEKRLGPLYDILQIVETEFRGRDAAADALGMSHGSLRKLGRILNNKTIRTGRH